MIRYILTFITLANLILQPLSAVPSRYGYHDDGVALKETRDTLEAIRHEVNNHESEIRTFEDKMTNIDTALDSLRTQLSDYTQVNKDQLKNNTNSLETRILSLESSTKGLVADIRQLKTHANDTSDVLTKYDEKIRKLEKILETQNQNIANLETALRSVADAMQVRDVGPAKKSIASADKGGTRTYKVKSGDSLGKIAIENHTTIKALKELNELSRDQIIVGQTLILPTD